MRRQGCSLRALGVVRHQFHGLSGSRSASWKVIPGMNGITRTFGKVRGRSKSHSRGVPSAARGLQPQLSIRCNCLLQSTLRRRSSNRIVGDSGSSGIPVKLQRLANTGRRASIPTPGPSDNSCIASISSRLRAPGCERASKHGRWDSSPARDFGDPGWTSSSSLSGRRINGMDAAGRTSSARAAQPGAVSNVDELISPIPQGRGAAVDRPNREERLGDRDAARRLRTRRSCPGGPGLAASSSRRTAAAVAGVRRTSAETAASGNRRSA